MTEPEVVNVYLGGIHEDPWIFDWGPGRFTIHTNPPPPGKPHVFPAAPSVAHHDTFDPPPPDILVSTTPQGTPFSYPTRVQPRPPLYGLVSIDDVQGKV
jgi:hypothetical protein